MLPQEESLDILIEFLLQHGYQKVQNIPLDIIRKLALIVIKENVFVYEKKFYRQVISGAMGSAFTLTLANIFMWKWEKQLVRRLKLSHEIYGRYPPRHIDWRLTTLFSRYLSKYFILPMLNTSDDFGYLRHQLLTTSTATSYDKVTRKSATNQNREKTMQNPLLKPPANTELTTGKRLIIHRRHEKRLSNNHRYIHELWNTVFHGTEVINTALMVATNLNQNLKQELCARMFKHIPSVEAIGRTSSNISQINK
ncbi:unnamed protein product [Rotaria socialis]|uniref:Uncharacterized protein n=2 Tax=Rotaria socialis TaxID=392032 RepID=A0A817QJU1_9BILA|nr:unnamed protein product [Rotaria socialis]